MEKISMACVSCMVLDSYDQVDQSLEKEWDKLTIQTRASIYLTRAWSRVWWEFYGKGNNLRIFIFRCEGKLVGAIPIYIEKIRFGLFHNSVARLVGAYNPPRAFNLPIIKEHAAAIGEHMVKHLVVADRCDLISIGPVPDESETKEVLFAAVEKMTEHLGIARDVPFGVYTYFDLPSTYEDFLRSLSQKERKNRRHSQNLLAKECDVRLAILNKPDEIESEMPQLIVLHAAQWRQQGKPGSFAAWPQADNFNRRLAVELARLGRTRLIRITAGEKPILYEYGYIFGDCCYWLVSARVTGEEWDRFSLGATGAVILFRSIIEEGIKRIEAGLSHYDYKTSLGAIESGASVLRLVARRPSSIVKYHLCIALRMLYLNFYFKLWYSRIQPKLPAAFHRSIGMNYIRLTF